jgi:hypothetical protein
LKLSLKRNERASQLVAKVTSDVKERLNGSPARFGIAGNINLNL